VERTFTEEDLKRYDGKNGSPVYLACDGLVYDATESWAWAGGKHMARHVAGHDLTQEIEDAPHTREFLKRLPLVGRMARGGPPASQPTME
jgi:predicted heme/steroid binding protein